MEHQGDNYIDGMVSVIMPAYCSEDTIAASIESILNQSYRNWELLIYDDFSRDNTLTIAEEYSQKDDRIKIMAGKENAGVASARNSAIRTARGRFIAFLDSDDQWKRNKLEKQIKFLDQNGCGLCYSSYELLSHSGNKKGRKISIFKETASYESLLRNNYIGTLTVLIDRRKIKDEDICFSSERHEDYLLWLSYAKNGYKLMGMDESLAYYRVSANSLSGNKLKAASWRWKVYYQVEDLGFAKSIFYMFLYTYNSIRKRI